MNYFYKSYFWLQFLKLDAESVNKKFEIICKWMRQLIVKLRPGSHQGSFGQLSVKRGLLSVITTRFLMRTMFYKFLKILEILRKLQRHRSVWWGRQILGKKQDTDSGAVNASHLTHMWPAVKLLMFSFITICHFPFNHALGSFPMQNFPHFHSTLAEIWSSGTHGNFV